MTANTVVVTETQTVVVDQSGPAVVTVIEPVINVVTVGAQGPAGPGVATRMGTVFIASPANGTIPLVSYAEYPFTINSVDNLRVESGAITISIQINGQPVTDLSNLNVTPAPQSVTATAENTVAVGDRVTLVIADAFGSNLEFTLKGTP
jgi:hypothetical protein